MVHTQILIHRWGPRKRFNKKKIVPSFGQVYSMCCRNIDRCMTNLNHPFQLEKLKVQLLKIVFEDVSQPVIIHDLHQQCKGLLLWKLNTIRQKVKNITAVKFTRTISGKGNEIKVWKIKKVWIRNFHLFYLHVTVRRQTRKTVLGNNPLPHHTQSMPKNKYIRKKKQQTNYCYCLESIYFTPKCIFLMTHYLVNDSGINGFCILKDEAVIN